MTNNSENLTFNFPLKEKEKEKEKEKAMAKNAEDLGPRIHHHLDISTLPTELLIEILIRLPPKFLVKLMRVSKCWYSIISSPMLIKTHLLKSSKIQEQANHHLLCHDAVSGLQECSLAPILIGNAVMPSRINHSFGCSTDNINIVGACNGIVCFVVAKDLTLWNPTIKKFKKLPVFGPRMNYFYSTVYGFWYDEINNDYFVFDVGTYYGEKRKICMNVYSLRGDSWRCIEDFQGEFSFKQMVKVVNGNVHWMTSNSDGIGKIGSFNLRSERYGEVEEPNYGKEGSCIRKVEVLGGCLCVCCLYPDIRVDCWIIMKKYRVKESWTKVVSMLQVDRFFSLNLNWSESLRPLFVLRNGKIVFQFMSKLVIYNPMDSSVRYLRYVGPLSNLDGAHTYVESLELLTDHDGYRRPWA